MKIKKIIVLPNSFLEKTETQIFSILNNLINNDRIVIERIEKNEG